MKIAIIPARGGSKRIPRKNIKDFCGKPIMARSIEAAFNCGEFDKIIVSSDDEEICDVARSYNAQVPFIRPAELSGDNVGITEVIAHATQWAMSEGYFIEAVCCIFATSPFIQIEDLHRGYRLLDSGDWDFSFTVTDYATSIFRSFHQLPEGGIEMYYPQHFSSRSQDLPNAFHDAGQFYWGRPQAWIEGRRVFSRRSIPIMIPRWRVQDIDTAEDWLRAEMLFHAFKDIFRRG